MDRTDVVELLLTKGRCDPNCTNKYGDTPLALTRDTGTIRLLLKHGVEPTQMNKCRHFLPGGSKRSPTQPTVTLFMIGNKGAGKSSLTKALTSESTGLSRWTARLTKVGGVKERTAGIECHQIHSPRIGSLTIYDVAGHLEFHSSHDTVIRSVSSGAMFLFVIDLTATEGELRQTSFFWLSSIENQVSSEKSDISKPPLLLIGSHADQIATKTELKRKQKVIENTCTSVSKIQVVGFVAANCLYSESSALTQVREHIFHIQRTLKEDMSVTFSLHCFHIYLITICEDQPGTQLGTVMKCIKQEVREQYQEKSPYLEFLPQDLAAVCERCVELNRRGIILYLQEKAVENSWVIVERDVLLTNINGTVFAPDHFQEHKSLAIHTGVVPYKNIEECFKMITETKHIHTELIIQFMIHMEFCKEIHDKNMLGLLAVKYPDYDKERHFLFPNLITESKERVERTSSDVSVWQPNPHITYSSYNLCWVLQCHGDQHYLSPRFLQVLLLRLAFQHALPVDSHKADSAIPGLKQACTLWQSGIKWSTTSLTEVLVEISNREVVVIMRCERGEEHALIHTRSQVIKEILSVKKEFCSRTETVEMFIPNPVYPVKCDLSVSIKNVTHSISEHKPAAIASNNSPIKLYKLLYYEPYMYLPTECLCDLYSPDLQSHQLTQQFIECASRTIVKCHDFCKVFDEFCTILGVFPHEISVESGVFIDISSSAYHKVKEMFSVWMNRSEGTYKCLKDRLDHFSVFSERNILEVAKIPVACSTSSDLCRTAEEDIKSSVVSTPAVVEPKSVTLSAASSTKQSTTSTSTEPSPLAQPTSGLRSPQQNTDTTTNISSHLFDTAETCPNLPELIQFRGKERTVNIMQEVGTKYRQFGILLLNDKTGSQVENIVHKHREDPEPINTEIMQEWIRGKGRPPTWEVLVSILEAIQLCELAREIQVTKL